MHVVLSPRVVFCYKTYMQTLCKRYADIMHTLCMDIMHELFPISRSIDRALSCAHIAIPCANCVGNHQATGQARPGQMLPHPEAKGPAEVAGRSAARHTMLRMVE